MPLENTEKKRMKKMNLTSVNYGTTKVVYNIHVIGITERGWSGKVFEEMAVS